MLVKQQRIFEALASQLQSGRISRRTFLERTWSLSLSSAALPLLSSCGEGEDGKPGKNVLQLIWQSEFDTTGAYQKAVDRFNNMQTDIHVTLRSFQGGTNDAIPITRNMLKAQSDAIDIYSVDVIYVPEFAKKEWIVPISEQQWPTHERMKYLQAPLKACTVNGQLWAAPYRTDAGLLYYRKDIIETPPQTWDELFHMAQQALGHDKKMYGYVWQGSQYEGLVCNFVEVLHGYGGAILDWADSTKVTVNSAEARQALITMKRWVENISPRDIHTYTEETTRQSWENGQAIFMRNWPYVCADTKQPFGIHPMLSGGSHKVGHSCIGGWQLAINAFISSERQAASWIFIRYMLSQEAQMIGAKTAAWLVALQDVYTDPTLLQERPLFGEVGPILQTALPRPVTPNYDAISHALRMHLRQALYGQASVEHVLYDLEATLKPLVVRDQR